MMRFGTSKSPKRTRSSAAIVAPAALGPRRCATPLLGSALAPRCSRKRLDAMFGWLLCSRYAASRRRVISAPSSLPGTPRPRFAFHGAQRKVAWRAGPACCRCAVSGRRWCCTPRAGTTPGCSARRPSRRTVGCARFGAGTRRSVSGPRATAAPTRGRMHAYRPTPCARMFPIATSRRPTAEQGSSTATRRAAGRRTFHAGRGRGCERRERSQRLRGMGCRRRLRTA